jgi:hypothetical protein
LARAVQRGWKRPFGDPIPLPRGRLLVTLEDAGNYITKLRKTERGDGSLDPDGDVGRPYDVRTDRHYEGIEIDTSSASSTHPAKRKMGDVASWLMIDDVSPAVLVRSCSLPRVAKHSPEGRKRGAN